MENPLFKRVGIFFVNDFYFNVYETSKNSTRDNSITKQYINNVRVYAIKVKQDKNVYGRLITDIHRFCTKSPKFGNLLFADFIHKFLEPFIPQGYETSFGKKQIDELLCKVITDFLTDYVRYVTQPEVLKRIIDKHDSDKEINCNMLFTETQKILENIQLKIYHEFTGAANQKDEVINISAFNVIQEKCNTLSQENNELNENMANLSSEYELIKDKCKKLERLVKLLSKTQITVQRKTQTPSFVNQYSQHEPLPLTTDIVEKIPSIPEEEIIDRIPSPMSNMEKAVVEDIPEFGMEEDINDIPDFGMDVDDKDEEDGILDMFS